MSYYNYICEECGEITLDLKLGTAKEKMPCPLCNQEMERCYSPTTSIWKTSGSYGNKSN